MATATVKCLIPAVATVDLDTKRVTRIEAYGDAVELDERGPLGSFNVVDMGHVEDEEEIDEVIDIAMDHTWDVRAR
jgi:hypothetical protein